MLTAFLKVIPLAIVAVILVVAVIKIYLRSKKISRSELITIFKRAGYLQLSVLITVCILTGCFGVFNYIHSKKSVSAILALNYSEASAALNSNSTRYNMAEITCDEVLEKAIEMGAFEKVKVKDLKACLSVYPLVQGDVQNKSDYHISTEFVLEYHASKKTEHLDSENVVKLVSSAYKEYYIEKYTDNFNFDTAKTHPDFNDMEYMDIVSYFNKETTSILNYLYGMAEKSSSFTTSNNTTFNSIAGKVHQFKETQIEQNLKSLILQYGIAKDKASYIDRLSYQNKNTDFDRQKNAISFDLCNKAIDMYSEEMTRVVLVPTWDEVGKYYMGRTKVGIDELSVKATEFSDKVANNEKTIMDNNLVIDKMQGDSTISRQGTSIDALIESIDKSIQGFGNEAITAGREFSNYRMNQCIAVSIYGSSLFDHAKVILVFAVLAYIAIMLRSVSKQMSLGE